MVSRLLCAEIFSIEYPTVSLSLLEYSVLYKTKVDRVQSSIFIDACDKIGFFCCCVFSHSQHLIEAFGCFLFRTFRQGEIAFFVVVFLCDFVF